MAVKRCSLSDNDSLFIAEIGRDFAVGLSRLTVKRCWLSDTKSLLLAKLARDTSAATRRQTGLFKRH